MNAQLRVPAWPPVFLSFATRVLATIAGAFRAHETCRGALKSATPVVAR